MIILRDETIVEIPNYDDLENKPKINGVTLEGDLTSAELGINLDTTKYYTKIQSDDRFQPKGNYQPAGNYLTSVPSEYINETELNQKDYATTTYVDNAIENIESETVDLSDYYTKGEVDNLIDNVEVDLTGYATEQWVENKGYLTSIPSEYVTETELNDTLTNKNYATKSEIPTVPSNVSAFNNDAGYITENALNGYASENWVTENYQLKGDYLTSVPSEYVTETELNEAIAGLGGTDVPYVVIEYKNAMTLTTISGDLQATLNAAKNKQPFLAYFYNTYATYGKTKTLYPFTYVTVETSAFSLQYHTEVGSIHKDVTISGSYDTTTEEYSLGNIGTLTHPYVTTTELNSKQDTLVSGTNIKTINGESILGSGDLTIDTIPTMFIPQGASGTVDLSILTPVVDAIRNNESWIVWGYMDATQGNYNMVECSSFSGDTITFYDTNLTNAFIRYWEINLTDGTFTRSDNQLNYATKSYVDTQIGDINTILENIIG